MREIFSNKRLKAGILLICWTVFIVFVLLLSSCTNNEKNLVTKPEEIDLKDAIDTLLSNPIAYKITTEDIETGDKQIYELTYVNGKYDGYIEGQEDIIKFSCSENKCYKVSMNHLEEIDEYYFTDHLDIFALKDLADSFVKDNDYYIYNNDLTTYKIFLEEANISKVIISSNNGITITFDINYKA